LLLGLAEVRLGIVAEAAAQRSGGASLVSLQGYAASGDTPNASGQHANLGISLALASISPQVQFR
jgi:hypothetical protein